MFNRRGFVSGAIYATIGLASSQGSADALSSPGFIRKIQGWENLSSWRVNV